MLCRLHCPSWASCKFYRGGSRRFSIPREPPFFRLYCHDIITNGGYCTYEHGKFDENLIIANGAKIYDQRAKIEAIADSIVDNGFDLLLFTSSGGSQAMLDPFAFYIRHMSRLPVENVLSANLMTGDCNRITDKTVAFLTSKSGDTAETVKAANWLKEQGVRLFAAVGKENSTLESICDDTIVYGEGRPQELVFYLLIGRILYRSGSFDAYPALRMS